LGEKTHRGGERLSPIRYQLSRRAGYRKPENTIVVARPGRYGNPYRIGAPHPTTGEPLTQGQAVELFRIETEGWTEERKQKIRDELAGRNLACWCRLGDPCHADVLLAIANKIQNPQKDP